MILGEEKLLKQGVNMVKSKRELSTPRKRNSLAKSCKVTKVSARPISAVSSVPTAAAANIRVVIRVRPPNQREQDDNTR